MSASGRGRGVSEPGLLAVYATLTRLLEPALPSLLNWRARQGKEDSTRLQERLGHAGQSRPEGPLAWLHGASVGESLSLLPLAGRLRHDHPDATVLLTSGTMTSARLLAHRLPEGTLHQFAPLDTPQTAARFLKHWRPNLAVFVESEIWPNLLGRAKARGCKLILASGKLSEQSFKGWRRAPASARHLLQSFDLVLAQDGLSAGRLERLGAQVDGIADLKFGASPLPVDPDALERARQLLAGRTVILAASTHYGEDELILAAFRGAGLPQSVSLVIVPRHPERGDDLTRLARLRGFSTAQRSKHEALAGAQVIVADTLGELGLWYRLAQTAIVGGSLLSKSTGHNPLEAARLNCPVIAGPHLGNWRGVFDQLLKANAVVISPAEGLSDALRRDHRDPKVRLARARNAREYTLIADEAVLDGLGRISALLQ